MEEVLIKVLLIKEVLFYLQGIIVLYISLFKRKSNGAAATSLKMEIS